MLHDLSRTYGHEITCPSTAMKSPVPPRPTATHEITYEITCPSTTHEITYEITCPSTTGPSTALHCHEITCPSTT